MTGRARLICDGIPGTGPVLYWMSRDQRAYDNWSLSYALKQAEKRRVPLLACFSLVPSFMGATIRAYDFLLRGLRETEGDLLRNNIPFILLYGDPRRTLPKLVADFSISILITDFDPLRPKRKWKEHLKENLRIPFYEVDSHNIIPCWVASEKREFAARTIRPKIKTLLGTYLSPLPRMSKHPYSMKRPIHPVDWYKALSYIGGDSSVRPVSWLEPGPSAGRKMLSKFISTKLDGYRTHRNDPVIDALSNLSPYLHFGQISAQRVAVETNLAKHDEHAVETFMEELVVRKELADNFCLHTPDYDTFEAFPEWSQKTLDEHRSDKREHIYSLADLENGQTHDELWNAGQMEMTRRGKMHGWMRMYWVKKILEWSPSPETAMERAIYLNDKYELDGRDPNGYTGIAWGLGGVHDRPWPSHPVFGKIRYMNYSGASRKFDIEAYVNKVGSVS